MYDQPPGRYAQVALELAARELGDVPLSRSTRKPDSDDCAARLTGRGLPRWTTNPKQSEDPDRRPAAARKPAGGVDSDRLSDPLRRRDFIQSVAKVVTF